MTTFLLALTMAVNIDRDLRTMQTEVFRRFGDPSALLLPPLIPIVYRDGISQDCCPDSRLDAIRKAYPVSLAGGPRSTTPHPVVCDGVLRLPVSLSGWESLRRACTERAGVDEDGTDHGPTPAMPHRFSTESPSIHLAWGVPSEQSSPGDVASELYKTVPPIPATAAFWLTVLEIDQGPEKWWDNCVFRIPYRRRLSVPRE